MINPNALRKAALDADFPDKALLNQIYLDIKLGAQIGCKGVFRNPSKASNAPSATLNGYRVADSIAEWVSKGFAYGPVDPADVPVSAKFAGLMTREKPNGAVRVILNLSAPKGSSVNDGIDTADFPTTMSSTTQWLRALNKAGKGCYMCKVDWSSAYKHLKVVPEDSNLQWFSFLGKCFRETSLVFGCASSAGLFDRLAKLVLHIVLTKANFPRDQVAQYLDDCCACSASKQALDNYDAAFFEVAANLGIELAPRDDPDKSFGPSKQGVILGIHYDTINWVWSYPPDKFVRLLHDLQHVLQAVTEPLDFLQRILGKILHVAPLIPAGKFFLLHLIKATSLSTDPHEQIPISKDLKRQVWVWLTLLRACNGRVSIPNPDASMPAWTVEIYTDAAGGSPDSSWRGVGAVCSSWWVQCPWGPAINTGAPTGDGKHLDRVMSALELLGPLLAISAAAPVLQGKPVRFWVDNAGSVFIYNKGYSTSCALSSALTAAIAQVAAFLGCQVQIAKITRCSGPFASMADALSKGDFCRFRGISTSVPGLRLPTLPLTVPLPIMEWVAAPTPDWALGDRLVDLLRQQGLGLQPDL